MLIQFRFSNWKSFKNETVLDLRADNISEFPEHIIKVPYLKTLPLSIIYGANGSGKTNLISAFIYMSSYVLFSLNYDDEDEEKIENSKEDEFDPPSPFLFDERYSKKESSFEVFFKLPKDRSYKTYNYGFTIDSKGINREWLNIKPKSPDSKIIKVIERDKKGINFLSSNYIDEQLSNSIKRVIRNRTLFVTLGAKLNVPILKEVYNFFKQNEFDDFSSSLSSFFITSRLTKDFCNKASCRKEMVDFISTFDPSIKSFELEKTNDLDETGKKGKHYNLFSIHETKDGKSIRIPFSEESSGTRKMFSMYPDIKNVLNKGSVLLVDEFNSKLHPLLARAIILKFLDPNQNKNHAQLICTSHEPWLLGSKTLRRDEIWFTQKNIEEATSSLYSLSDFSDENGTKIRSDENFEKNYMLGKYDGVPVLNTFEIKE